MKENAISLRQAIALPFGLLLILSVAAQAVLHQQASWQWVEQQDNERLMQLTALTGARIDALLIGTMSLQRVLAAEIANSDSDIAVNPNNAQPLIQGMTNAMSDEEMISRTLMYVPVANNVAQRLPFEARQPIASTPTARDTNEDITQPVNWVETTLGRRTPQWFTSSTGCARGTPQCLVYASVVTKNTKIIGIAAAAIPMQAVNNELRQIAKKNKEVVLLFDAQNRIVGCSHEPYEEESPLSQTALIQAAVINHHDPMVQAVASALAAIPPTHERGFDFPKGNQNLRGYVASYSTRPELQWRIVAIQIQQDLLAETDHIKVAASLMAISLGCLGILAVCWLTDDAAGALRSTTEAARSLSLQRPYAPVRPDWRLRESHQLVHAFDSMAKRLQLEFSQLRQSALTDPVTGLLTRSGLLDQVQKIDPCKCALFHVSLPHFQSLCSVIGTDAGNQILYGLATRMRDFQPKPMCLARIGQTEFALLFEDIGAQAHVSVIGPRLQELFDKPVEITRETIQVPAAIGSVEGVLNEREAADWLQSSEFAATEARVRQLKEPQIFSQDMREAMSQRFQSIQDIQRALDNNEFVPHYQPIIDLLDGRVAGIEALIRWQHPQLGLIQPKFFLSLASESDLIVCLDRLMLKAAVRDARALYDQTGQRYVTHVNVSARYLLQASFLDEVHDLLQTAGIPRDYLTIEINEVACMLLEEKLSHFTLHGLNTLGVRVAVDDFGPGQSTLSCLGHLAIGSLKIDRSFVVGATETGSRESLLTMTIVRAANALNATTVAEGIETPAQLDILRRMGCRQGQGYLFAPPTSLSKLDLGPHVVAPTAIRRLCES